MPLTHVYSALQVDPERPVLVDKYLDRADELDVDALCDKDGNVTICGIMQHIEQASCWQLFLAVHTHRCTSDRWNCWSCRLEQHSANIGHPQKACLTCIAAVIKL